jgi:hypothetical protein
MSDPLRIGLVAEGITDKLVIQAAITSLLGDRPFILRLLQPEESLPLGPAAPSVSQGKGWGGVYLWGRGILDRNEGKLDGDILFFEHDVLILHLDADVAGKRYSDCEIEDPVNDLPCEEKCPPPSATTDRLRAVLLRWVGETAPPAQTVLCTPSKSLGAWVVGALFPDDKEMRRKGWECCPEPEKRLKVQKKEKRIKKSEADYKTVLEHIAAEWPRLRADLSEARRFSDDFIQVAGGRSDATA